MTIEWALAAPVSKPWGRADLRPWSGFAGSGETIGEIRFERSRGVVAQPALLLKLLFTNEPLSIQVHPDDALAHSMGLPNGKSEAWYILEAGNTANVGLGLTRALDTAALRAAIEGGQLPDLLDWRRVKAGDVLAVPAGTIHALGADLVVAEIQQNSDITFRLFDHGRSRSLHLNEGIVAARAGPAPPIAQPRRLSATRLLLVEEATFTFEKIELPSGSAWTLCTERETWVLIIAGAGRSAHHAIQRGEAIFVEADRMDIQAGPAGLVALVAYQGLLQTHLLDNISAGEGAAPPRSVVMGASCRDAGTAA